MHTSFEQQHKYCSHSLKPLIVARLLGSKKSGFDAVQSIISSNDKGLFILVNYLSYHIDRTCTINSSANRLTGRLPIFLALSTILLFSLEKKTR